MECRIKKFKKPTGYYNKPKVFITRVTRPFIVSGERVKNGH